MAELPESRRYGDEEIALILKRAAEMPDSVLPSMASGLTLDELQRAAQEAGISPQSVARAAAALERSRAHKPSFLGASTKFQVERIIEGELTDNEIADLIPIVRREFELPGSITSALGTVEWHADHAFGHCSLTVTPRDGKTRIRVLVVRGELAVMTGGWIGGLAALGTLVVVTAVAPFLPPVGAIAIGIGASGSAGYGSLRMVWRRLARSWHARLNSLGNELAQAGQAAIAARARKLTGGDS